ncbi:MAG: N-acetylneuraminate synthase family protein, partial [Candidatus Daviesbacteria bacterium]|nr:N-acetylneuraminate synthase family protein [Candidatus Daviesbacteria bacterium]
MNPKSKKSFRIAGHPIKEGGRVFIIAEAGVNHNQKLDLALRLVDIAADAGADAVKFQTFKAEQVVTEKGEMASYQKKNTGKIQTQRQMLKGLELPEEFYPKL